MRRFSFGLAIVMLATGALAPREARAQGYGVYEQNTCTMGRAGTAVAAPCNDGSAMFFNPAGLAKERRMVISLGGTLVGPSGGFTNDVTGQRTDLEDVWSPVPAGYGALPIGDRTTIGLGVFVPYGLETRWPSEFEGRYLGYRSVIQAPYVQPTIAFKVSDQLYVGGGLDIVYTNVELQQRAELSSVPIPGTPFTFRNLGVPLGTDFADVNLRGHGWGFGAHVGVLVEPTDRFSIGARYLSQVTIDTDDAEFVPSQIPTPYRTPIALGPGIPAGTPIDALVAGQFASGGRLAEQGASTSLTHPDQFVAGVAVRATPRWLLLFDYQWTNWEDFDEVVITTENGLVQTLEENYGNTNGYRFGTEIALTDAFTLRGGYLTHDAGAPDESVTPNLPEGTRKEYTLGVGLNFSTRARFDLAYQYLDQDDRRGRTVPLPLPNNGVYEFDATLLGFGFTFWF